MKITRRTEQEINISELKAAIKEGRGLEVIRPHDEITLALDTGETITPVCGYVGKHSARFVFKDCLREMWQMNKDMTAWETAPAGATTTAFARRARRFTVHAAFGYQKNG